MLPKLCRDSHWGWGRITSSWSPLTLILFSWILYCSLLVAPEAKTLVPRPQIQEPRPQASDLCQDDLEFKPPSWPQPSDSQQYFSASAPLSPSARPRSPWGKLDPYDSSEVEPPAPVCAVG